jgi:hypothetical protein
MNDYDPTAIVTAPRIREALNRGNRDGVRRLALFVGAESAEPQEVFESCQEQRRPGIREALVKYQNRFVK